MTQKPSEAQIERSRNAQVERLPSTALGINFSSLPSRLEHVTNKKTSHEERFFNQVQAERLELSHLAALDPKSSVSTNSTTPAYQQVSLLVRTLSFQYITYLQIPINRGANIKQKINSLNSYPSKVLFLKFSPEVNSFS